MEDKKTRSDLPDQEISRSLYDFPLPDLELPEDIDPEGPDVDAPAPLSLDDGSTAGESKDPAAENTGFSLELPEGTSADEASDAPVNLELSKDDPADPDPDSFTLELPEEDPAEENSSSFNLELTDAEKTEASSMNLELDDSIPEQNEPDQENSSTSEEYSFTLELPEDDGVGDGSDPADGNEIDDAAEAGDEGIVDGSSGTTPPEIEPDAEEPDKKPKETKDSSPDETSDGSGGKPPRNIKPGKIILPVICLLIIGAAALAIHLYLKAKDAPQTVVKEFLECAKELDFEGMDARLQSHDLTAFDRADVRNEAYRDYFLEVNKKMTCTISGTSVDLAGETAQVTAHVKYLDNTGVYREALSDLLRMVVTTAGNESGDTAKEAQEIKAADSTTADKDTKTAEETIVSSEETDAAADDESSGKTDDKTQKSDKKEDEASSEVEKTSDTDDKGNSAPKDEKTSGTDNSASEDDNKKTSEIKNTVSEEKAADIKNADSEKNSKNSDKKSDSDANSTEQESVANEAAKSNTISSSAPLTEEQIQETIIALLHEKKDASDPVYTETDIVYPLIKADGEWKIVSLDAQTIRAMSANCVSIEDEITRMAEAAQAEQVKNVDEASLIDFECDRFAIKYTGSSLGKDFPGNPCLMLYYNYTNKGTITSSAMVDVNIKVYQHGKSCPPAIPEDNRSNTGTYTQSVEPGETINVCQAFSLQDTSDVTVQASEAFHFGDGTIHSQILTLNAPAGN